MSERLRTVLIALIGPALGIVTSLVLAPDYFDRGFPLDDAWIHAVYARSLAQEGSYAYNPGEPATGATSLLWPLLLAIVHASSASAEAFVLGAKLLGAGLHVCATAAVALALRRPGDLWTTLAISALVGMNPDLLAASLSGMEVSLATLVIAAAVLSVRAERDRTLAAVALLAYPIRPEVALLMPLLPIVARGANDWRAAARGALYATGAVSLATALVSLRTWLASGRPLPATFYAKVGTSVLTTTEALARGFTELFDALSILRFAWVWLPMLGLSLLITLRKGARERVAAATFVCGALGCAASFALAPPLDAAAFYHQRYVLPFVFCMIAAIAPLWRAALDAVSARFRPLAFALPTVALVALAGADTPFRIAHLANDALNIDDVQVRIGKALATEPATFTTWTVDAGAVRYFAAGFVVDIVGLNTPEMLGSDTDAYTARHAPNALVLFADMMSELPLPRTAYKTSTAYSVTSIPAMGTQVVIHCEPPADGTLVLPRARHYFRCASGGAKSPRQYGRK